MFKLAILLILFGSAVAATSIDTERLNKLSSLVSFHVHYPEHCLKLPLVQFPAKSTVCHCSGTSRCLRGRLIKTEEDADFLAQKWRNNHAPSALHAETVPSVWKVSLAAVCEQ